VAKLNPELGSYAQPGIVRINGSFQTNGASAPTVIRDGNSKIVAVTRVSAGLYEVTLDASGFPIPQTPINILTGRHVLSSPVGVAQANYVGGSWSQSTRKFRIMVTTSASTPVLVTGQTVTANVATLTAVGPIVAVQATAGSVTGANTIALSGTPATHQVVVTYSSGVPTLTFLGSDSVSACEYVQLVQGAADPDSGTRVDFEVVGAIIGSGVDPA
jgi:hypothetical protein